jgi:hypothetical protein
VLLFIDVMLKGAISVPACVYTLVVASFCFIPLSGVAQQPLASISGTVEDQAGLSVAGARVEIQQQDTRWTRMTQTESTGTYSLANLPIGPYHVKVFYPGFRASNATNIRLLVGQERILHFKLSVTGRTEQVLVTSSISEIDQTSAVVQGRMVETQVAGLPLNGRNWSNLLPLIPGATDAGTSDQRTVRFAGHGRDDNNISFDGVDATGISNQPQKTGIRLAIPASTIAEFKVDSTLYTADSADGTGGQIVLVSRGGTNAFHGELFDFVRNDVFDARNTFATGKQPFRLNQFGANASGPLLRDKTFFFIGFEAYRQRLDQALTGFTPSANYRARMLAQSPELAPILNLYPPGDIAQPDNPDIDRFAGMSPQRNDETSGMFRVDQRFSAATTAFLRVNVDEEISNTPLNNLRDRQVVDNRPINSVLSVTHVLAPSMLNELKAGFNQVFSRTASLTGGAYTVQVSGFTQLSGSQTREEDDTSASLLDNFSWAIGRHTLKAGVEGRRIYTYPATSPTGTLVYRSPAAFLSNQLNTATVNSALPLKRLRKNSGIRIHSG